MPITDQQYQDWLKADNKRRVLLAEAKYYPTGGPEATEYFSNGAFTSTPADTPANIPYDDIVDELPVFRARMSEIFASAAPSGWGDLVLTNESGVRDPWLNHAWDGRALTLYFGDADWPKSDYRAILTGVSADIVALARDRLALRARDKEWQLNVPLQKNLIGGSTANKDKPKPNCYGPCFNVEPPLIDAATHEYQVHDGAINDVPDVRDNGVTVGYTKDLANGKFTLNAAPAGRITCDVQGAKPGGTYLTKPGDIVKDLITTRTTLTSSDLDTTSFSDFNTTCPQSIGFYSRDFMSVSTAVDQILASVGSYRSWDRAGDLFLGRLVLPTGTEDLALDADDVELDGLNIQRRILPVLTYRMGYKRNWTPQVDGLAGAVTEANRALYAAPYQAVKATNSGVDTMHLLAAHPDEVPTLMTDATEAQTECDRRADLWEALRYIYEVRCYTAPFKLRLGQIVKLTHPRFGFAAGKKAVIIGFSEFPTRKRATLELFA